MRPPVAARPPVAMRSMLDRVGARLQRRVDAWGDLSGLPAARIRDCAVELLSELLPLDDSRRAEVTGPERGRPPP
ncbi:hypothetical protein ACWIG5_14870 [Streptomyces lydicus]